jgi:adenylate cyclase
MLPPGLSSFTAELYRRQVVKVGVVYALVAFTAMEVAGNFFPALHLPEWTATMVAALLLLGLPVALALAWAFEVTPSGIRLEVPLPREPGSDPPAGPPPAPDSIAAAAAVRPRSRRERYENPVWSVAVLPFTDLSPTRDQGFFVEGITEEIRHALSRVDGLSVVARRSSLAFQNASLDIREIGRRLGVSAVLEGSLRQWKDRVVVTTQLISVADGFEIWSDSYDGGSDDVLNFQSDIAGALIAALGPRLPSRDPIMQGNTSDPAAHRAFLKGRKLLDLWGREDLTSAIQYFRRAVELDPAYAAAHVGIADAYSALARLGYVRPRNAMPEAEAAARQALSIDPRLAAAHKSLGLVLHRFEWQPQEAEAQFRRAVELNPGYAGARYALGEFLMLAGRPEDAIEALELARDLDPVSTIGSDDLVTAYSLAGRHELALRQAEQAVALSPRSATAHRVLGVLHHRLGSHRDAADILQQARLLDATDPSILAALAATSFAMGSPAEARALGAELLGIRERVWGLPYQRGAIAAVLGDEAGAFAALEECCAERVFDLARLPVDSAFDSLRGQPRFQRVLELLGQAPAAVGAPRRNGSPGHER